MWAGTGVSDGARGEGGLWFEGKNQVQFKVIRKNKSIIENGGISFLPKRHFKRPWRGKPGICLACLFCVSTQLKTTMVKTVAILFVAIPLRCPPYNLLLPFLGGNPLLFLWNFLLLFFSTYLGDFIFFCFWFRPWYLQLFFISSSFFCHSWRVSFVFHSSFTCHLFLSLFLTLTPARAFFIYSKRMDLQSNCWFFSSCVNQQNNDALLSEVGCIVAAKKKSCTSSPEAMSWLHTSGVQSHDYILYLALFLRTIIIVKLC